MASLPIQACLVLVIQYWKYIWCKEGVKSAQLLSDKNAGEDEQQANNNGKSFIHK